MMNATPTRKVSTVAVALALLTVYIVWGSTYLAIRFALAGYPPLFFPALRFLVAGGALYVALRLRGVPPPRPRQWVHAAVIGVLLLDVGNGGVVLAERDVGSALAATTIATVPLWAALFAGFWGHWPARAQWLGLAIGFAGVVVLNMGGEFAARPLAALCLMISAATWAFGSILSKRLDLPAGLMSSACQMLVAGIVFLIASRAAHEPWAVYPNARAFGALVYLIVFGSLLGFTAYIFLVQNVSPALATSYAYVNPVIALFFGAALGGERFTLADDLAIALVLIGVALIVAYHPAPSSASAKETPSCDQAC